VAGRPTTKSLVFLERSGQRSNGRSPLRGAYRLAFKRERMELDFKRRTPTDLRESQVFRIPAPYRVALEEHLKRGSILSACAFPSATSWAVVKEGGQRSCGPSVGRI
jgi:hypothetical protein